jgi:hypothetical protein
MYIQPVFTTARHQNPAARIRFPILLLATILMTAAWKPATAQQPNDVASPTITQVVLKRAMMCEDVQDLAPINPGAVFSMTLSKITCFSHFDPVSEKTVIYHNWYFRDQLSTRIKLNINPPRWSTFSTIQLRQADKGPWRVEITREDGTMLTVLRFSVTD